MPRTAAGPSAPLAIEEPPPPPPPAPKRKRKSKLVTTLLLVIGFPVAALSALLSWGMFYNISAKTLPVSESDKAALFTAADLSPFVVQEEVDPSLEVFEKLRYIDRSMEISYEFDDEMTGIYVLSGLSVEASRQDAVGAYAGMRGASSLIGLGLDTEARDDLLKWGDTSECLLLASEGDPVGHWFIARKDKRIYTVMLLGVDFSEGKMFRNLLVPKLEEMERHELKDEK